MAELKISDAESPGIIKEIDEGAIDLVFQAMQEDIYSYPIRSFVREAVSNSLDSIKERDIAKAILNGEAKVEDHYRTANDGKLLKDSVFDKDYYDLSKLGDNKNVLVNYSVENESRDKITIKDFGVGLGGSRLRGFFKIGFSSKRNLKSVRGKFGVGAKAGLATGVDYFIVTTVYNGYQTSFMVYRRDYEPITEHSYDGKEEVWTVMTDKGEMKKSIYWTKTTELNSVTVELLTRKHNRRKFINAVKQQFSHFYNVKLMVNGISEMVYSEPEYNDENVCISSFTPYSSPIILVDGISYGAISWENLDLEKRYGSISIKVSANDVDITQSRESLKWTTKTRNTILKKIELSIDSAEKYIESNRELSGSKAGILSPIKLAMSESEDGTDYVTSVFALFLSGKISVKSKVKVKGGFPEGTPDIENRFNTFDLSEKGFRELFYHYDVEINQVFTQKSKKVFDRAAVVDFNDLMHTDSVVVYITHGYRFTQKVFSHLCRKFDVSSVITIRRNAKIGFDMYARYSTLPAWLEFTDTSFKSDFIHLNEEFPQGFDDGEDELLSGTNLTGSKTNWKAIRRANQETVYQEIEINRYSPNVTHYRFSRETVKQNAVNSHFDKDKVIVVTGKTKILGQMLLGSYGLTPKAPVLKKVIMVAESEKQFFSSYTSIENYMVNFNQENKSFMLGEEFYKINTAARIVSLLNKYKFVQEAHLAEHLCDLDPGEISNKIDNYFISSLLSDTRTGVEYKSVAYALKKFLDENSTSKGNKVVYEVMGYLQKLSEIQDLLVEGKDTAAAILSKSLVGSEVLSMKAYDKELVDAIEEKLSIFEGVSEVIGSMSVPSSENPKLKMQLSKLSDLLADSNESNSSKTNI